MHYLADTANIGELKALFYYFPLEGITTNPSILKAEGEPLSKIVPRLLEVVGGKMIHIQMISSNHKDMVREAELYREYFDLKDNFYVKIPVTIEGYKAMSILKDKGFNVTATAIFTQQEALVAARAGADYVAPYVNRLDNISSHGIEVVSHIVNNINTYGLNTKVLAASFKTVDQVHRVSVGGCHAATISYEILDRLRSHPMTDMSVEAFEKDGKDIYDLNI